MAMYKEHLVPCKTLLENNKLLMMMMTAYSEKIQNSLHSVRKVGTTSDISKWAGTLDYAQRID